MTILSTGQLTIVDNNDARQITAYISANPGVQQIYTKDESSVTFTPNWTTINSNGGLELKALVYASRAGSPEDITGQLTNRKWTTQAGGTALVTGAASAADFEAGGTLTVTHSTTVSLLQVKANLKVGNPPEVIFFEGDYTDPVTGLVSKVITSISLTQVRTGTNAVYINLREVDGDTLEPDTGKSTVRVFADLVRAAGVDDSGVTYRWYQSPHGAPDQIDGNLSGVAAKYGLLTTAQVAASATGAIGQFNSVALTTTNVPDSGWTDAKGIIVHASAVVDIGNFKVEIKDSDGTIYQTYFTLKDVSDPYEARLISTAGDKLQNGVGTTDVYPQIYYGAEKVNNTTGMTFVWYYADRSGQRGAFVDTTRTAVSGGRTISANTVNSFTYSGTAITFSAGDIVKANLAGSAEFFEVASSSGNTVTVRAPTTNTWMANAFVNLTANKYLNGAMFVCVATRTTVGTAGPDSDSKITVTGDDVDAKGVITVEVNK
jgi:hypothetical protein